MIAGKYEYAAFKDYGRKPLEDVVGGNRFAYATFLDLDKHGAAYTTDDV